MSKKGTVLLCVLLVALITPNLAFGQCRSADAVADPLEVGKQYVDHIAADRALCPNVPPANIQWYTDNNSAMDAHLVDYGSCAWSDIPGLKKITSLADICPPGGGSSPPPPPENILKHRFKDAPLFLFLSMTKDKRIGRTDTRTTRIGVGIDVIMKAVCGKRPYAFKQACMATKGARKVAEWDNTEDRAEIQKIDNEFSRLDPVCDQAMSGLGCTANDGPINAARTTLAQKEQELAALKASPVPVRRSAKQAREQSITDKAAEVAQTKTDLKTALEDRWACNGKDLEYNKKLTDAITGKSGVDDALKFCQAAADTNLKAGRRQLLNWVCMELLPENLRNSVIDAPLLGDNDLKVVAAGKNLDGSFVVAQDPADGSKAGFYKHKEGGGFKLNDKDGNAVGDYPPTTKAVVKEFNKERFGKGLLARATGLTGIRGTLGYMGGYGDTFDNKDVEGNMLNAFNFALSYRVPLIHGLYIEPYLAGGVGHVAGDSLMRKDDTPQSDRAVGLVSTGSRFGYDFGWISPYLLAEAIFLPGLGYAVGTGLEVELGTPLVSAFLDVRFAEIPDTGVPAGIREGFDCGNIGLSGLSLNAGLRF